MSSFLAIKLDITRDSADTWSMERRATRTRGSHQIARLVRARIEQGGERIWRLDDFRDLPYSTVARALSRLARLGAVERVSKGIYYRSRQTTFGKSLPNSAAIQELASKQRDVFPAGIAAASLLGFTTQTARRGEVATTAGSLPRKLLGADTVIHTRRPAAWRTLTREDAALLDLLRRGGTTSELPPGETIRRTMRLLSTGTCFERLARVARTEPPRARALLGALGEEIGAPAKLVARLRASLNPLSLFKFGLFTALPNARRWQAKGRST